MGYRYKAEAPESFVQVANAGRLLIFQKCPDIARARQVVELPTIENATISRTPRVRRPASPIKVNSVLSSCRPLLHFKADQARTTALNAHIPEDMDKIARLLEL